jgi:uncharacterized protein (DUF697 family)
MMTATPMSAIPITKADQALFIVQRYLGWSAGAGLVPLPGVDLAALIGIQMKMISDIARVYDVPFSATMTKSVIGSLLGGFGGLGVGGIVGSLLKGIPVVGPLLGFFSQPAVSSAATYAVGKVFIQHFDTGGTLLDLNPEKVREHFRREFEAARAARDGTQYVKPDPAQPGGTATSASETTAQAARARPTSTT